MALTHRELCQIAYKFLNPEDKPFIGNKQVECDYMLSALRRMELRGHLNEIYDGVIVNKKEGNAA